VADLGGVHASIKHRF